VNAYQQVQSSGIHWPAPARPPLYEAFQERPGRPQTRERPALFESLEEQMAEFSAQHEAVLGEVRKCYALPADSSVRDFLTEHRTLPYILLEAAPQLKTYFGEATIFSLRAPIDDAGSRTLYAVAMWPGRSRDVREALARFDDSWWIAHSRQASGYLTFTYELT